jgi:hypothetical protein
MAVLPAFVTEIFLELAPAGTVTPIKFAVTTLTLAAVPVTATAVVLTKKGPLHHEHTAGLTAGRPKIDDPRLVWPGPTSMTQKAPLLGCHNKADE